MSELFFGLGLMFVAVILPGLVGGFRFAAWESDLKDFKFVPDRWKCIALLCFYTGALMTYSVVMAHVSLAFFVFISVPGGITITLFIGLVSAPCFEWFRKMKRWHHDNVTTSD